MMENEQAVDNRIFPYDRVTDLEGSQEEVLEHALSAARIFSVATAVEEVSAGITKRTARELVKGNSDWTVRYMAGVGLCMLLPRNEQNDAIEVYAPTMWIEKGFDLFPPA